MDTPHWKTGLPSRGIYPGCKYGPAGTTQNSAKANAESLTQDWPNPHVVHTGSQICFAQLPWRKAKHEPAVWCGSTECQQHTGMQQQPVVWEKGWMPSTWHLPHITWRAYSVYFSSSCNFGTRHTLINLIIFSGELPPRRLGLEQISFWGNSLCSG